jgi:hypothetical protein
MGHPAAHSAVRFVLPTLAELGWGTRHGGLFRFNGGRGLWFHGGSWLNEEGTNAGPSTAVASRPPLRMTELFGD